MQKYLWILAIIVLLTPLGSLAEGTAWGEWGGDELQTMLGYVPQGVEQAEAWWRASFPDYTMELLGDNPLAQKVGYMLSAVLGSLLVYVFIVLVGKIVIKSRMNHPI